jgi:uncharacterized protein YqgC (DUF456 family)
MDLLLTVLAVLLSLAGLAGCVIPGLPGPPLNYIALWMVQAAWPGTYSNVFLITGAVLTILILVLDYYLPIWTAKRFGATRQGIAGSIIGMFAGMFLGPLGMIIGLAAGALIGDRIAGRSNSDALKSAGATVFGTLFSIGFKLMLAMWFTMLIFYDVIRLAFHHISG